VLDPFFGTGTVGLVARELGRDWLGVELNSEYVEIAWERLGMDMEAAA
jgi:DNA modification methylase